MSDDQQHNTDTGAEPVSARQNAQDRLAKIQRQQQRSGRRGAVIAGVVAVALLLAIGGGGWYLIQRDRNAEQNANVQVGKVQTYANLSREHKTSGFGYKQQPPPGGAHHAAWANCGVYNKEVPPQHAVHSLEHGAVWITYKSSVPAAQRNLIAQKANRQQGYVLVTVNDKQSSPIVLSAWGAQVHVNSINDAAVDPFIQKYWRSPEAPEAGASCDGAYDPATGKLPGQ